MSRRLLLPPIAISCGRRDSAILLARITILSRGAAAVQPVPVRRPYFCHLQLSADGLPDLSEST
jgi:hypothetical protein